jgi:hypothetical protein
VGGIIFDHIESVYLFQELVSYKRLVFNVVVDFSEAITLIFLKTLWCNLITIFFPDIRIVGLNPLQGWMFAFFLCVMFRSRGLRPKCSIEYLLTVFIGVWDSVVVKELHYYSEVSLGIFSEATDGTICPGVDSASKTEYQDIPGGEGGRCVGLTTFPPS